MEGGAEDEMSRGQDRPTIEQQGGEKHRIDDGTPVNLTVPIKKDEDPNQDYHHSMETDAINTPYCPLSMFSQSSDMPYPVDMFENKLQTGLDKSVWVRSSTSTAICNQPGTCNPKDHSQKSDKDLSHSFTPAPLKSGSQEADVKYELDKEGKVGSVMDSKCETPERMSSPSLSDAKTISGAEETNDTLPVLFQIDLLKQDETEPTVDQDVTDADKMKSDGITSQDKDSLNTDPTCSVKQYICKECGKSFRTGKLLIEHNWQHNLSDDKPFRCNLCRKSFTSNGSLTAHNRIHSGERPFGCKVCGKGFHQSSNLKKHIRIHSGDKPFECETCGKSFTQSSQLTSHIQSHSGIKPYECNLCEKSFSRNHDLMIHIRIHNGEKPYTCSECGKSFIRSSDLKVHNQVHNKEKPFNCDVCGKSFQRSSHLKDHSRKHTGEMPYKCSECDKACRTSELLRYHKRAHHSRDEAE